MVIHIHIPCDYKCKFNSTTCNSIPNWNNETCQCDCKKYCKCKNDYSWNATTCICEKSKHLKHIANNLAIACDGTIYVMDIVLTNMANTILLTAISLLHSHFRVNVEWAASLT